MNNFHDFISVNCFVCDKPIEEHNQKQKLRCFENISDLYGIVVLPRCDVSISRKDFLQRHHKSK